MSGATTELSLATAVDSDDNADYLTLSLANSLRTVDALFNAVTGHTHNGSHQGAPVPASTIPNGSISNAQLGPDVARASLLTNGGFEIWQRGNGPFTTMVYHSDRWFSNIDGTDALSVSKDTANADVGSSAAMACTYTKGTGTQTQVFQKLEDGNGLRGRTLSLSMRVKSSVVGAVRIGILDTATWHYGTANVGSGAYETLTISWPVSASATLVQVSVVFSASCTAYIDNAMLVIGSQPADYAPLHPTDELARCLRYYERLDKAAGTGIVQAFAYGATNVAFLYHYKVFKAVVPTITFAAPANYTLANAAAAPQACVSITNNLADQASFQGGAGCASGLAAGNASFLSSAGSGGYFAIEANQ